MHKQSREHPKTRNLEIMLKYLLFYVDGRRLIFICDDECIIILYETDNVKVYNWPEKYAIACNLENKKLNFIINKRDINPLING